uniref:Uncharacterized protein n=1 Tax=Oryza barthii TaxID=65489 RepID=A0A0D3FSD6_9ORYZ
MAWFGLPNPDMELVPRNMPLPEIDPLHNPPPSCVGTAAPLAAVWHHECTIRGKQLGRKRRPEGYLILTVWQPRSGTIAVSWTMTGSKVDLLSSSAPSCGVGCKACLWIVLGSWFVHGACRLLFQFQARPKSDSCAAPREVEWGTGNEGVTKGVASGGAWDKKRKKRSSGSQL